MGPLEAGARDSGRGRLGHGPGRLWPWPRRPGVRGTIGTERGRKGAVTVPGLRRVRHRSRPRDEDAANVTLSPGFLRRHEHVTTVRPSYRTVDSCSASRGPDRALGGPEGVTFAASSSRPGPPGLESGKDRRGSPTSAGLPPHSRPSKSRASRGGHSLPGPPRDGRDASRAAAKGQEDSGANSRAPRMAGSTSGAETGRVSGAWSRSLGASGTSRERRRRSAWPR